LVALNSNYSSSTLEQTTIHQWLDKDDDTGKFGAFLPGGVVLVAESKSALEDVLQIAAPGSKSAPFSRDLIPADAEEAVMWAVLPSPERPSPPAPGFGVFHVKGFSTTIQSNAGTLTVYATLHFDTAETAAEGIKVAEGILALGRLQDGDKGLKELAKQSKVTIGSTSESVVIEASAPIKTIVDHIAEKVCKH